MSHIPEYDHYVEESDLEEVMDLLAELTDPEQQAPWVQELNEDFEEGDYTMGVCNMIDELRIGFKTRSFLNNKKIPEDTIRFYCPYLHDVFLHITPSLITATRSGSDTTVGFDVVNNFEDRERLIRWLFAIVEAQRQKASAERERKGIRVMTRADINKLYLARLDSKEVDNLP